MISACACRGRVASTNAPTGHEGPRDRDLAASLALPTPFHGAEPPSPRGRAGVSCVRYLPGRPRPQAEWCDFVCVPGASAPLVRPWLSCWRYFLAGGEERHWLPRPAAAAGGAPVEPAVRVLCDRSGFGGKGQCKAGGLDAFFLGRAPRRVVSDAAPVARKSVSMGVRCVGRMEAAVGVRCAGGERRLRCVRADFAARLVGALTICTSIGSIIVAVSLCQSSGCPTRRRSQTGAMRPWHTGTGRGQVMPSWSCSAFNGRRAGAR